MSIIYDALKKAEKTIHGNLETDIHIKPQNSNLKFKLIALYVGIICLGLIAGNIIFNYLSRPKKTIAMNAQPLINPPVDKKSAVEKEAESSPKQPIPTLPAIENEAREPFVLNGIFFSQDEPFALINNQIVRIGDTVDGALVLRITAKEVELNSAGATIKLSRSR
jgi:hypothetical protein